MSGGSQQIVLSDNASASARNRFDVLAGHLDKASADKLGIND